MSTGKKVLIFLSGAVLGGLSTWFAVKKFYETKADLEVESVKKAYNERLSELEENNSTLDGSLEGPNEIDIAKTRTHSSISETLNNKPDLRDYTKFFKASGDKLTGVSEVVRDAKEDADKDGLSEEELAEMECPPDDEPYTEEEDENETLEFEDYQLNGEKKKAFEENREPYVIDAGDYELTCAQYEKMELTYRYYDAELMEDDDTVDRFAFVGNLISETGFDDNEDDILYVRNDKLQTDFKIVKEFGMD